MKKTGLIILFFVISITNQLQAQKFFNNTMIDVIPQIGYIAPHCDKIKPLSGEVFMNYEINFSKKVSGTQQWKEFYHNPIIGIDIMMSGLGRNPYLGSAYGILPNINFQIAGSKRVFFGFRLGAGIGYLSKCYYTEGNTQNIAIGSHFNAAVNLFFNLRVSCSKYIDFITGIAFTHYSNGAIRSPNLGINIPAINVGIGVKDKVDNYKKEKLGKVPREEKKFEVRLVGAFGLSDPVNLDFETTYSGSFTSYFLYNHNIKSKFGIVADIFYDERTVEDEVGGGAWVPLRTHFWRPALSAAYLVNISKFAIVIQLGSYVYTEYGTDGYVFERIGLQYLLFNHLIANLSLKAHFAKADHIEFGIGYKI